MIGGENVDRLLQEAWRSVQLKVEQGHPLSSEKTLCFLFAMEMAWQVGPELHVDFENQCYEGLQGNSKYLDLLFYTDPAFKVAVEFKLPKSSQRGGSNQTQTREKVYRDLARLKYLKTSELSPSACYFLMAANEDCYLNDGNHRLCPQFRTFHGHDVLPGNDLVAEGLSLTGIKCSFRWGSTTVNPKGKRIRGGAYAWLQPIRV